jgi:hypothetical protein
VDERLVRGVLEDHRLGKARPIGRVRNGASEAIRAPGPILLIVGQSESSGGVAEPQWERTPRRSARLLVLEAVARMGALIVVPRSS